MTSHDVCRQHRRLFRPEQRSCGIGCPCPGEWKRGGYGHGGKGGMAGAGQGTCALHKAGSGKESPLSVTAGPRREDGDLSGLRRLGSASESPRSPPPHAGHACQDVEHVRGLPGRSLLPGRIIISHFQGIVQCLPKKVSPDALQGISRPFFLFSSKKSTLEAKTRYRGSKTHLRPHKFHITNR